MIAMLKSMAMCLLAILFANKSADKITIYLIGDSTMSTKAVSAYPETGWGMPFSIMFDSTVAVENHAMNGRSTRTFISENRWGIISDKLEPGDYVFIQFGHNDESKEKADRYTSPDDYKKNLVKFITDARAKNAKPLLITPVSRRKFTEGRIQETHAEYSRLVLQVAQEKNVPLIDLDKLSRELLQDLGEEKSKLLFLQLEPGEHPNYPMGKDDNTHFNELGARKIAQLVLQQIRTIEPELAKRIVRPVKKN
jgi:lysophospholipase L1-like esterase